MCPATDLDTAKTWGQHGGQRLYFDQPFYVGVENNQGRLVENCRT
jgi:hypothetical protein